MNLKILYDTHRSLSDYELSAMCILFACIFVQHVKFFHRLSYGPSDCSCYTFCRVSESILAARYLATTRITSARSFGTLWTIEAPQKRKRNGEI